MTFFETLKKRWYVPFAIFGILILIYFSVFVVMGVGKYSFALVLTELKDGTQTPDDTHLTEQDFENFPKLASIIRDKSQKPHYVNDPNIAKYQVYLSNDEEYAFISEFGHYGVFEYKGKRYEFAIMNVDM